MLEVVCAKLAAPELGLLSWIEAHPGLAAWLQAIFSVVAIAVAAIMALIPLWAQERERRRQHQEIIDVVKAGVRSAVDDLEELGEAIAERNEQAVRGYGSSTEVPDVLALARLGEIPVASWPSAVLYSRVRQLERAMTRLRDASGQSIGMAGDGKPPFWLPDIYVQRVNERLAEVEDSLGRLGHHIWEGSQRRRLRRAAQSV